MQFLSRFLRLFKKRELSLAEKNFARMLLKS